MSEYEEVIQRAEEEAARGEFKDAYNTLGAALTIGGPDDDEVRYRRGVYAYRVGHSRLNQVERSPDLHQTLIKAGCWLSRSEAYLTSVAERSSGDRREQIQADLARTKHEQDRFRKLCRTTAGMASASSSSSS